MQKFILFMHYVTESHDKQQGYILEIETIETGILHTMFLLAFIMCVCRF